METKKSFGDAIVSQELNKEAWKQLSREFKWNEELLLKYRAEIDWDALSNNIDMLWTVSILDKFKHNINWSELSDCAPENLLTPKIIERFADRWDWHCLSDNYNLKLTFALLDRFVDKWDWKIIINRLFGKEIYTPEFLERYKEYIPVEHFKGSNLWKKLVEKRLDELVEEIVE